MDHFTSQRARHQSWEASPYDYLEVRNYRLTRCGKDVDAEHAFYHIGLVLRPRYFDVTVLIILEEGMRVWSTTDVSKALGIRLHLPEPIEGSVRSVLR